MKEVVAMVTVEIVVSGNEVLAGDVLDSNAHWLCKKVTGLGGRVNRIVVVRDSVDDIAIEIKSAMERESRVIFTTGGMGPTADDVTLEAVAIATNCPLELHAEALAFVKATYEDFARKGFVDHASMSPSRQKMALLPRSAEPLANRVGGAPGVVLTAAHSTIVSLPGVPAELQGIFESSLQPILQTIFGESVYLEKIAMVDCKDESVLAPLLESVSDEHTKVYIKSRAKRFGTDVTFSVTFSAAGNSKGEVEHEIESALQGAEQLLRTAGISIVISSNN
jgi:nicotinamide-nucleotide amidase